MKPATWIIVFVSFVSICLAVVSFFNWWADPFCIYNHEDTPFKYKYVLDERLQKTSTVRFSKEGYDAVLFGSSVATYINQNHFNNNRVFNYAASGMRPEEFDEYLKFFKQENTRNVKMVFISADFLEYFDNDYVQDSPESYVEKVSAPGYRVKKLLSFNGITTTLRNILKQNRGTMRRYYEPGNIANITRRPPKVVEQIITNGLRANDFRDLKVDHEYESHLDDIIAAAADNSIIVFTSPISHFRTKLFFERGLKEDYENWLRLLVRKFGKVFHFSDINSITSNHRKYYYDSYHSYPEVGDMIIKFIESEGAIKKDDFGVVLTPKNIDGYLDSNYSESNKIMR
ncbi:hypothetical protein N8612_00545 [Verrucomicrobia bacterium]|nr:hypothetical protein [Verrucomicrobiota bacterium]